MKLVHLTTWLVDHSLTSAWRSKTLRTKSIAWTTVPGGSISGNNKVWRRFIFAPITTSKIRVLTNASVDGYSRLTEVEAWGYDASTSATIQWLVTDHLGTPRMIVDQTGTLANVKRHDYLPFGEELFAPDGGRSARLPRLWG